MCIRDRHTQALEEYHRTNDRGVLKEFHTRRRGVHHIRELTGESFDNETSQGYWVIQFHTGQVEDVVNEAGGEGPFQKAAEQFESMVKFGTLNAVQFSAWNHKYHRKGEKKYPVFRVFGAGKYLCHAARHKHAVDWVTDVLNVVKWGGCTGPDTLRGADNDSPAVHSEDYKTQNGIDQVKYKNKLNARRQAQGLDLGAISDEL
eukprot:TRINITY_DN1376_c0_g1_i1.p1 TRINITY_DN1376_c0_g1~~TRINITY_DN1376_c0_g1_i1.p1  ORF type:complete len:203 (-),score=57.62 TRINITY_DN1376_c0_g1_i1:173-781(-)